MTLSSSSMSPADHRQIAKEPFTERTRIHVLGGSRRAPHIHIEDRDLHFGSTAVLLQIPDTESADLLVESPSPESEEPEHRCIRSAERRAAELAAGWRGQSTHRALERGQGGVVSSEEVSPILGALDVLGECVRRMIMLHPARICTDTPGADDQYLRIRPEAGLRQDIRAAGRARRRRRPARGAAW